MTNNAVHGVEEIIKVLREECRRSVKKEITSYDIFEYVSSEIPLFGKQVPIIAVKAKDSLAIPEGDKYVVPWVLDNQYPNCMRCNCAFTVFGRRHHCRACGFLVCKNCSNAMSAKDIVETAVKADVRICRDCQTKKKGPKYSIDISAQQPLALMDALSKSSSNSNNSNNNSSKKLLSPVREMPTPEDEDEDGWKLSPYGHSSKSSIKSFPGDGDGDGEQGEREQGGGEQGGGDKGQEGEKGLQLDLLSKTADVDDPYVLVPTTVPPVKEPSTAATMTYVAEIERLQEALTHLSSVLQEKETTITNMTEKAHRRKQSWLENQAKLASLEDVLAAQGQELGRLRDQVQQSYQAGHSSGVSDQQDTAVTLIAKEDLDQLQSLLQAKDTALETQQQESDRRTALLQRDLQAKDEQCVLLQQRIESLVLQVQQVTETHVQQTQTTLVEKEEQWRVELKRLEHEKEEVHRQLKEVQETQLKEVQLTRALEDTLLTEIEQLRNALQVKEVSCQALQDTCVACQAACSTAQTELQETRLELQRVQETHATQMHRWQEEQSQHRLVQDRVTTLEKENTALQVALDTLRHSLEEANACVLTETQKRQALETQLVSYQTSQTETAAAWAKREDALLSETAELRAELVSLTSARDTLVSTLSSLETRLSTIVSEKEAATQSLTTLQDTLRHTQESLAQAEMKRVILEQEVHLFKEECLRTQHTLSVKTQACHELQSQVTRLEADLCRLTDEVSRDTHSRDKKDETHQTLASDLQTQIQTLNETVADLQRVSQAQEDTVTRLRHELTQKTSLLEQVRQEFDKERIAWTSQMSYQSALLSAKDADLAVGLGHLATREVAYDQLAQAFAMLEEEQLRVQEMHQASLAEKDRLLQLQETQVMELKTQLALQDTPQQVGVVASLKEDLQTLRALMAQQERQHAQELIDVEADFVTMEAEIAHYKEALDLAMMHREQEEVGVQTDETHLSLIETQQWTERQWIEDTTNNHTPSNEQHVHNNQQVLDAPLQHDQAELQPELQGHHQYDGEEEEEEEDLVLRVPSYLSQVSYDPYEEEEEEDRLETLSHVSDETHQSSSTTQSSATHNTQQTTNTTATSTSTSKTTTKKNFLLENKQKVTKLSSAMKTLTNKHPVFEPSSAAKAKTVRSSLAATISTSSTTTTNNDLSLLSPPPSSHTSTSNTTSNTTSARRASSSTSSSTSAGVHKPLFTSPSTPAAAAVPSISKPPKTMTTTQSSTPGQIKHHKLNYILENKAEVKRTSDGVGILKKQSQQHIVVDKKTGTTVTASVMSTASLAVLKQSISHETHAEFVNSNYKSLGDLDGEKLQQLAHKASLGDLRLLTNNSSGAETAAEAGVGGLLSPKSTSSRHSISSSSNNSSSSQLLRRKSSLGGATLLGHSSSQQSLTGRHSVSSRRASTGTQQQPQPQVSSSSSSSSLKLKTSVASQSETAAAVQEEEESLDLRGLDVTAVEDEEEEEGETDQK